VILAIDSSAGTSVALVSRDGMTLAEASSDNPRGHAEVVGNLIDQVFADSSSKISDIEAVVMGVGPGPFTGLRVGMAAAQAVAWGQSVPVWPVVSMDSAVYGRSGRFVVWSDQKRRERAWALYEVENGLPIARQSPTLCLVTEFSDIEAEHSDCEVVEQSSVSAADLARVAIERQRRGLDLASPQAMYLRPPDVTL